jgi:hypothetical protein
MHGAERLRNKLLLIILMHVPCIFYYFFIITKKCKFYHKSVYHNSLFVSALLYFDIQRTVHRDIFL